MKFSSPLKQQGLEKLHCSLLFLKQELPFQVAFQKTCFQNILQQPWSKRALCALFQKHHSRSSLHAGTAFWKTSHHPGFLHYKNEGFPTTKPHPSIIFETCAPLLVQHNQYKI